MTVAISSDERRAALEERIFAVGEIDFATMARQFSVSEMTIRRDVEVLERKGRVRRIMGGAIAFTGKADEPSFESRVAEAAGGKAHIAAAVGDLLHPHETVLLDSGSSALAVARTIQGRGLGLTIVTPSILAAVVLAEEPDTIVLLTGGRVRPGEMSLIGAETEAAFALYNCDTYVMGIAGIAELGVTDYHREESNVKRAAMRSADRIIVVADSSKLGRVRLMNIAPLSALSVLVTDGPPTDPTVVAAREAGVEVVCVAAPG
ncbi:DeoR/GlpR family DNA-binding transcription regulator, partial [Georgenia sp.]